MELPHVSGSLGIVHPICIERGRNAEVWDEQGRHYVDFIGGIGVLNLGHGHPVVVEAVRDQLETLMHSAFNALPHRGYLEVAKALNAFVPVSYPLSCMLTNSGAEATENALKVARAATGRQAAIAFDDGFHGRTLAALNLNGKVKPYKNRLGALPGSVHHVPFPSRDSDVDADRAMAALERLFAVEIPADEVEITSPLWWKDGESLDALIGARVGQKAVDAANDPMIELARIVDPAARAVRKRFENEVDEPKRQAYSALANVLWLRREFDDALNR